MTRIQKSINDGKISAEKIFAMNLFEEDSISLNFIKENNYTFNFISRNESLINQLETRATPTTYLLEKTTIHKASTGISIIGIYQLENYLNE